MSICGSDSFFFLAKIYNISRLDMMSLTSAEPSKAPKKRTKKTQMAIVSAPVTELCLQGTGSRDSIT